MSAGQTHPQAAPEDSASVHVCVHVCARRPYGHDWSHTWPLTGTATAETDPKSVVHVGVEVAMGWERFLTAFLSVRRSEQEV